MEINSAYMVNHFILYYFLNVATFSQIRILVNVRAVVEIRVFDFHRRRPILLRVRDAANFDWPHREWLVGASADGGNRQLG